MHLELVKTFKALEAASAFRRRHLTFLKTMDDIELVRAIGLNQALGNPIGMRDLLARNIASVATVQRRLSRLRQMGVVLQNRTSIDKRVLSLKLSPVVWQSYLRLGRQMQKIWSRR
jgi:hypothetical protein